MSHFYTKIPMWFKLDEFLITCNRPAAGYAGNYFTHYCINNYMFSLTGSCRDHFIIINNQSTFTYTIPLLKKNPENFTKSQITRNAGGINNSKISNLK